MWRSKAYTPPAEIQCRQRFVIEHCLHRRAREPQPGPAAPRPADPEASVQRPALQVPRPHDLPLRDVKRVAHPAWLARCRSDGQQSDAMRRDGRQVQLRTGRGPRLFVPGVDPVVCGRVGHAEVSQVDGGRTRAIVPVQAGNQPPLSRGASLFEARSGTVGQFPAHPGPTARPCKGG